MNFRSLILLSLLCTFFSHNVKTEDNQYYIETSYDNPYAQQDELVRSFCKPIKFTRTGVRCFLRHSFSHRAYTEYFLPHNFCHMVEFLEFGKDSHQNSAFLLSTLRLFSNKVKACCYVTAEAFSDLLDRLPNLVQVHFVKQPTSLMTEVRNIVKNALYSMFLNKFSFFKEDPDEFFDELSGTILQEIASSDFVQHQVDKEQLRQAVIRFLELTMNKIIWSPLDSEDVWISVKTIADQFTDLKNDGVINEDELNDLFQSLIEQFIHFLALAGSELPLEVIDMIQQDIDKEELLLFTLEEQEEYIETKANRLKAALDETAAKIHARSQGIITEMLPV